MPDTNDRYLQNISVIAEALRTSDSSKSNAGSAKIRVLRDVVIAFARLSEVGDDDLNPAGHQSAYTGTIGSPTNLFSPVDIANDEVNLAGRSSAYTSSITGNIPIRSAAEDEVTSPAGSIVMPTNPSSMVLGDPGGTQIINNGKRLENRPGLTPKRPKSHKVKVLKFEDVSFAYEFEW